MSARNFIELAISQAKNKQEMTEKQQRVFEAAISLFAEKGYASTSTSEIAKAAGVAEGTIFRHFGSKENLLFSVILPFIIESIPIVADEFIQDVFTKSYPSFESFLTALIENRLHFVKENQEIFKILVVELLQRDDLRMQLIAFFQKAPSQHINRILDGFKQRGELIDLPNFTLIRSMLTQIFGYFMIRFTILPNRKWDDATEVKRLVQLILHGVGA
ncbi:TetR/AcrR family transcriptional regulator [Neobacillus sp. SM06]|uniref:TetR/AcrR family transcriptional regulator n=1 Tax=Neobacillus sp. SM06 TaxID=3422492 RepID=UPI003D2B817F